MTTAEQKEPDLSLLGKFVYFYPTTPADNTIGPGPLPNNDGTPHPATIYNIHSAESIDLKPKEDAGRPDSATVENKVRDARIKEGVEQGKTMVDISVEAHGGRYCLEGIELYEKDAPGRPLAVFPADNKKWLKATADEAEKQAKAEAERVKASGKASTKSADTADDGDRYTKGELEAMTKQELCDVADGIGAQADLHMTKDEIVAAILKQQKANG